MSKFLIGVKNNKMEEVKELLANGADVHEKNDMAIKLCAMQDMEEMARLLYSYGANIHCGNETPLLMAIKAESRRVASFIAGEWAKESGWEKVSAFLLEESMGFYARYAQLL